MGFSVREKADTVASLRYASVFLMETLARWVATTPEMEVKALFGQHIWDLAQHADDLGKRTADLRAPLQHSRRPLEAYDAILAELAGAAATAQRVGGFYDVMVPELRGRYQAYLQATDALLDQPTVRIIERILRDLDRLGADRDAVRRERPDLALADPAWQARLSARFASQPGMVDHRPAAGAAMETA